MSPTPRRWAIWASLVAAVVVIVAAGLFLLLRPTRPAAEPPAAQASPSDIREILNQGKAQLEHLDYLQAIESFQQATRKLPSEATTWRDLADADLRAGKAEQVLAAAQEVLDLDHSSAAALYLIGCANLRLWRFEPAVQALEQCKQIDPNVAAVRYQLGVAQLRTDHAQAAVDELRAAIALQPEHPSAHYVLGQALVQLGDETSARIELAHHQQIAASQPNVAADPYWLERCAYTEAVVPFALSEQPADVGIPVKFVDATSAMIADASKYRGPLGIINLGTGAGPVILVRDPGKGLQLLKNKNGVFEAAGDLIAAPSVDDFQLCLVGDLKNDGVDNAILVGPKGSLALSFARDGQATDVSASSGIQAVGARAAAMADLDFTGKLGLLTVSPAGDAIRTFRNQGNSTFKEIGTSATNISGLENVRDLQIVDWNGDDLPDVLVTRGDLAPLLLANQRGGPLAAQSPPQWPACDVAVAGDLNNDLRMDLVAANNGSIQIVNGGTSARRMIQTGDFSATRLALVDYDNDGWLDIVAAGQSGLRVWRNLGEAGFRETTHELGLDALVKTPVREIHAIDLDGDGDLDLLLVLGDGRIQYLRNDGGNANHSVKIRLAGTRSNSSGLGSRIEAVAGGWRTMRTVDSNPTLIGIGRHESLDRATVHWFDLAVSTANIKVTGNSPITLNEPQLPTGSCPNLYAWDGHRFRYVCDILGSAPAGLRLTDDKLIDADTNELVWIGNESAFPPKDGKYLVSITDELRELLYLDEAKLVAVDHPAGTEVHSLDKLVPGKPFPPKGIVTLGNRHPLGSAIRSDGLGVTGSLQSIDQVMVSPVKLRPPQVRGLAELWSVTLDFGPLEVSQPLVLALSGWLRFGGGMANVAASHNPDLPFPFPKLEAQTPEGWKPLDVTIGAPSGKTKTIIVDLTGKLPPGARKLRLSCAFEIYWDRIAMFEKVEESQRQARITRLSPALADLRWHGFGDYESRPSDQPLTPYYDIVRNSPPWSLGIWGWCTRYGDVRELLAKTDDQLVILNAGDEVMMEFDAAALSAKNAGDVRDFFLYTDGWDKDGDYHIVAGDRIEPIPRHGMDDQAYGRAGPTSQPAAGDWKVRYNTRWVGPRTLQRQ